MSEESSFIRRLVKAKLTIAHCVATLLQWSITLKESILIVSGPKNEEIKSLRYANIENAELA